MLLWKRCWKRLRKCEYEHFGSKFESLIHSLVRFLLVALNIEAILGETSVASRKEMLREVEAAGVGLDSVYFQTLQRIREQRGDRSRLGMEVLMWVSHAERPLRIDELCHALAVDMQSTDLDPENVRPQDTVLGSCLGLAVVDAETSTVRLIHYTLQEYISQSCIFPDADEILGQICLTYLNHTLIRGLPANSVSNLGDMPFLKYSSLYWGSHAKIGLTDHSKPLALDLLNHGGNHIYATLLVQHIRSSHSCSLPYHLWPSLHCASYFGIDDIVTDLIEREGCDINQSDCMGFTALMWAAQEGNEGVVKRLLTRDEAIPAKPNDKGETPLWAASWYGNEGVVKLLLARKDVDPDKLTNDGRTPLWAASWNGHEGVVKLLLARNHVDPDKPDSNGGTPLLVASLNGHEGVVELLLARNDVDPSKLDSKDRTPLWVASYNGHEGVVKLLLAQNHVNPDKPDSNGGTPLWTASYNGHEGVVKLLLARNDVNPDKPDNYGGTPLWTASNNGHEGVVKLLLARSDVSPHQPNNDGETPFSVASSNGRRVAARRLRSTGSPNPDKPDNNSPIPIKAEPVAQPASPREDICPDQPKSRDQTPPRIYSLRKRRQITAEPMPRLSRKRRRKN